MAALVLAKGGALIGEDLGELLEAWLLLFRPPRTRAEALRVLGREGSWNKDQDWSLSLGSPATPRRTPKHPQPPSTPMTPPPAPPADPPTPARTPRTPSAPSDRADRGPVDDRAGFQLVCDLATLYFALRAAPAEVREVRAAPPPAAPAGVPGPAEREWRVRPALDTVLERSARARPAAGPPAWSEAAAVAFFEHFQAALNLDAVLRVCALRRWRGLQQRALSAAAEAPTAAFAEMAAQVSRAASGGEGAGLSLEAGDGLLRALLFSEDLSACPMAAPLLLSRAEELLACDEGFAAELLARHAPFWCARARLLSGALSDALDAAVQTREWREDLLRDVVGAATEESASPLRWLSALHAALEEGPPREDASAARERRVEAAAVAFLLAAASPSDESARSAFRAAAEPLLCPSDGKGGADMGPMLLLCACAARLGAFDVAAGGLEALQRDWSEDLGPGDREGLAAFAAESALRAWYAERDAEESAERLLRCFYWLCGGTGGLLAQVFERLVFPHGRAGPPWRLRGSEKETWDAEDFVEERIPRASEMLTRVMGPKAFLVALGSSG